ncbi:MAG: hypothetical protein GY754_16105 [bacterium]|nr:hypothetical protein [bacterium]
MDIWKWVENTCEELQKNGQTRLADLVDLLPTYAVNNEHNRVDAIVPEALALARSVKNHWLEVYIRHWNLQSRLFKRYEVAGLLSEAVNLLEFAHREETRACPQSICAVQDIAKCYALIDGPAYVQERLAVAEETLAKIDAAWPCFTCISSEKVYALLDRESSEEALDFLDTQQQALIIVNQRDRLAHLYDTRTDVLLSLKRYEEAYNINEEYGKDQYDKSSQQTYKINKARILAFQGSFREAEKILPSFNDIAETPSHFTDWTEAVTLLTAGNVLPNDWKLHNNLQYMYETLFRNGVFRKTFELGLQQAYLALEREQPFTAKRCGEKIEALIPKLREPLNAPVQLEELKNAIAEIAHKQPPPASLPDTPEEILNSLGDSPEDALVLLEAAGKKWPGNSALLLTTVYAYNAINESEYSRELMNRHLLQFPDSPEIVLELGQLYLNSPTPEQAKTFAQTLLNKDSAANLSRKTLDNGRWILSLYYLKNGEEESARKILMEYLDSNPEAKKARMVLAGLERKSGNPEKALQHLNLLVQNNEEAGDYDWDRMITATMLEQWGIVRDSARRLGMNLEGSGPIEEDFGPCSIEFVDPTGEKDFYYAQRTGPVTARIIQIAEPDNDQHYRDYLIFDPLDLNETEEEEEHDKNRPPLFAPIKIISEAGYSSYAIDGVYPGEEQVTALKEKLAALGCETQVQSDSSYQLFPNDCLGNVRGLYAFVAVPKELPPEKVAHLLAKETASYEAPLTWTGLLEKLGQKDELLRHREIEEAYGL